MKVSAAIYEQRRSRGGSATVDTSVRETAEPQVEQRISPLESCEEQLGHCMDPAAKEGAFQRPAPAGRDRSGAQSSRRMLFRRKWEAFAFALTLFPGENVP